MKLDYFNGMVKVPNLIGDEQANEAARENFQVYVDAYETEFLKLLLGDDLYASYDAGVTAGTTKYVSLQSQIYDETTWVSPAAYYIFCQWLKETESDLTGLGEQAKTVDGAERKTYRNRLIRTWNRMSDLCDEVWDWLEDETRNSDYDDFNRQTNAYLTDHNSRSYSPFEKLNQWGI